MNKYLIAIIVVLCLGCYYLFGELADAQRDVARWRDNTTAVSSDMERYQSENGNMAVEVTRLRGKVKELQGVNAHLLEQVRALGVSKRRVESVTEVAQGATYIFRPDTVFITERDTVRLRTLEYSDRWLTFSFDSVCRVTTHDTITVVRHGRRRRFLWWSWVSRRNGQITVTNANPYVEINSVVSADVE